jgi:hypothetical protein
VVDCDNAAVVVVGGGVADDGDDDDDTNVARVLDVSVVDDGFVVDGAELSVAPVDESIVARAVVDDRQPIGLWRQLHLSWQSTPLVLKKQLPSGTLGSLYNALCNSTLAKLQRPTQTTNDGSPVQSSDE